MELKLHLHSELMNDSSKQPLIISIVLRQKLFAVFLLRPYYIYYNIIPLIFNSRHKKSVAISLICLCVRLWRCFWFFFLKSWREWDRSCVIYEDLSKCEVLFVISPVPIQLILWPHRGWMVHTSNACLILGSKQKTVSAQYSRYRRLIYSL